MPYADYKKTLKKYREDYQEKYQNDPKFVEAEKERARAYYEANREKVIARVLARRAELKAAKDGVKKATKPRKK